MNFLLDTREKNEAFGSSLLLANSPMSPKVVNGSFAAIFDADEFLAKAYAGIRATVSYLFYCTVDLGRVTYEKFYNLNKFTLAILQSTFGVFFC